MKAKVVMLVSDCESSRFMYNGLKDEFNIEKIIVEGSVSKRKFINRRIKRLGLVKVFGQLLFQLSIPRILNFFSKPRIKEIIDTHNLIDKPLDQEKMVRVSSVNSDECLQKLIDLKPHLIVVNGTRIISKKILNNIEAVFLNTHMGITPKYRGVHGGYWALAMKDKEHCGVTVHKVDAGIDTGAVIGQALIDPKSQDNFTTYTYLQAAAGLELMKSAIDDFKRGALMSKPPLTNESKLWYHPTLWYYIKSWLLSGVK